ncbi:retrovirus-related pol polyprotein from transposon TNT 1-94, partial [Tanacetum coccineum]
GLSVGIKSLLNAASITNAHIRVNVAQLTTKFVRDFKSLAKEDDESLEKIKCKECKYDKISYDKAYNDMQHQIERLQGHLGDLKGKSSDTQYVTKSLDALSQKLDDENVSLEWQVIEICLWCVNSGCSKHMTGNLKLLINFIWKFMGNVHFRNDHVAAILGYSDPQWGNILITWVYFVKGLGHDLFSVGQFCDSDLEVAFRRNTGFVRNLDGVDMLKRNHSTNLYIINLHKMAHASPICLMAHATSTKSCLWHQCLSHLKFDTINTLAKCNIVIGLPKFKYSKDHLCLSCEQGKSKKTPHMLKPVPDSKNRLQHLHMDLCGPMRVKRINGKWYVLVIMDDYSHYTWVHFLRSKDEAPEAIIKFLKQIQVLLQAPVIIVRTNNRTKFTNLELKAYFEDVGISHQTSSVRNP